MPTKNGPDRRKWAQPNDFLAVLVSINALAKEAGAADPGKLAHQLGHLTDGAPLAAMLNRDAGRTARGGEGGQVAVT